MYMDDFLSRVKEKTGRISKRTENSYICSCPAHDDINPSLSVGMASDGKILLKCFSGCSLDEICTALDLRVSDLFLESNEDQIRQREEEYIYKDESNCPLYKKIRVYPKKFYINSIDKNGLWGKGLNSDRRVLYRLPEVICAKDKGETIFIVEGEKDAERLFKDRLIATTPIEGAGSTLRKDYRDQLKGANVVLLFDEDKAGYQRRDQWLKLLNGHVSQLKVVKLPGIKYQENRGEDISDWLKNGHTIDELIKLVEETSPHSIDHKEGLVALNLEEFLSKEIPQRAMILDPIIPEQGLIMLYSKRGVGKTFLSLAIGYAVAAGIPLLRWKCMKSVPVLYVDGEMPALMMQERLLSLIVGTEFEIHDPSYFRIVTPDIQNGGIPDISTAEGQQLIESVIGDAKLVILDNLSTLAPSLQENESDAWAPIQSWGLQLRRRGISLLLVHHAGKSGKQRGTSRREDILDTVINLKHADGYSASEGASFEVHFEKARGFFGDQAESFVVTLGINKDGGLEWTEGAFKEDIYADVVEEIRSGNSYRKTAEKFQITKSRVEAITKKARELGELEGSSNA